MHSRSTPLIVDLAILAIIISGLALLIQQNSGNLPTPSADVATSTQAAAGASPFSATGTTSPAASFPKSATTTAIEKTLKQSQETAPSGAPLATRIEHPYASAPLSPVDINVSARAALVNILCYGSNSSVHPISGSGVLIDPRGVILTNAHVAQYVLLSQDPRVDLKCYVRSGSPAVAHWVPKILYIPPVWVHEHVADVNAEHPLGTGEHDYALLSISSSLDGSPLPVFPVLVPDTREAIAFVDDTVLAASYPAEFASGSASFNLYSASSFSTVRQFLTFATNSVDVISIGSVIEAQSGSSGGAIVNAWGRLVGIITTTSEGTTTSQRELRGITLSYIDRDLIAQSGSGLSSILAGDTTAETAAFSSEQAPALMQLFFAQITK